MIEVFQLKRTTLQTDNGTEFSHKYIGGDSVCPFDKALQKLGIKHKLVPREHHGTTGRRNEVTEMIKDIFMTGEHLKMLMI